MPRFSCDAEELSLSIELDVNEPHNLAAADLGRRILTAAVERLITTHQRQESPDHVPWKELALSTIRAKKSRTIGTLTGEMFSPRLWHEGRVEVDSRRATWFYPHDGRGSRSWGKLHGFHHGGRGKPPRPALGWTPEALEDARRMLAGQE